MINFFNIFECGRNLLDQLDVTYQRAFTASETSSFVPTGYYELSPARERYYDMQSDQIKEKNVGMDKNEIRKAISRVKLEDEEEHERNIEYMSQDDDYKSTWKIKYPTGLKAVMDSSDSDEKPAARKEPITSTQTLKEPIKGSHLGKRVRHSEVGSTDMDNVVTGLGIIGQGGPRAISGGSHTQSIIKGGENIVRSDVITHVPTNPEKVTLRTDYFPFDPLKAQTLMVASLVKPFLTSNGNVRSASIIGSSRPDQSRIIAPGMNEYISSRYDVRSTVQYDSCEADKLDAAVQRSSTDEWNTASSQIEEGSPESIFRKIVEQFDSSERMNLANSLSVHTPELVSNMH